MHHTNPRSAALLIALVSLTAISRAWTLDVVAPSTLTMDPNLVTPLAGVVQLTTDVPTRVTLHVTHGAEGWAVVFPDYRTDHAVAVLGLKPDRSYTVEVTVTDETGASLTLDSPLAAVTDPLPADFPAISLLTSDPVRMEPGFTLLDKFARAAEEDSSSYSFIVDPSGEVVWYAPRGGIAMQQLPNGDLLYRTGVNVVEVDMLGQLVNLIQLANPGDALHHELFLGVRGTYFSLSRVTTVVDGYPTSLSDPTAPRQTAFIEDDPVVEFAADGSLLNVWPLTTLIDPTRAGYDALQPRHLGFDWAHANSVIDSPADDSILVSIRHQDAIVKFSRDGQLKWILAPHENWSAPYQPFLLQPIGAPFSWQYHQHAPAWTPSGNLLVFDNGNYRASPFDGTTPSAAKDSYSRAVEYAIDEDQMTVRQVWEYSPAGADRIYSLAKSDVDWLPSTGNVLITYSAVGHLGGVASCDLGLGAQHTRIQEVDHATPAQKVFELAIYDASGQAGECPEIQVYRSERIRSLYPSTVPVVHAPALTLATRSNQVRRGKGASYTVTVANPTSTTQCYEYWADLILPNGSIAPTDGEFLGPVPFCVEPFATSSRTLFERVPTSAPVGWYTYNAYVGAYPVVLSEASGPFFVAP